MTERDLDVVVFGATGITVRNVALSLAERASETGARWAAAARDSAKLERVLGEAGVSAPETLVADLGDASSLAAMASRARVVLNLVGPYTSYGRPVIEACVAGGAHYADVSGEMPFICQMIDACDARAQAAGVKVVQVRGFEALPPDLSVRLAAEKARERWEEGLAEVDLGVTMKGLTPMPAISGGTLQTFAAVLGGVDLGGRLRRGRQGPLHLQALAVRVGGGLRDPKLAAVDERSSLFAACSFGPPTPAAASASCRVANSLTRAILRARTVNTQVSRRSSKRRPLPVPRPPHLSGTTTACSPTAMNSSGRYDTVSSCLSVAARDSRRRAARHTGGVLTASWPFAGAGRSASLATLRPWRSRCREWPTFSANVRPCAISGSTLREVNERRPSRPTAAAWPRSMSLASSPMPAEPGWV